MSLVATFFPIGLLLVLMGLFSKSESTWLVATGIALIVVSLLLPTRRRKRGSSHTSYDDTDGFMWGNILSDLTHPTDSSSHDSHHGGGESSCGGGEGGCGGDGGD